MSSPPEAVPASKPRRVVILCLDTLGDLVLRQPLFAALLDSGSRVTVAVRRGFDRMLPFLDPRLDALVTDLNPYSPPDDSFPAPAERLRSEIAEVHPDVLVCALYNRTYLDEWLLRQLHDLERVGFATVLPEPIQRHLATLAGGQRLPDRPFTRTVACDENAPEIEKNAALLRAISGQDIGGRLPRLSLPDTVAHEAAAIVEKLGLVVGRYVLGCPGGTARTDLKAWPPESYAELAERLSRRHRLPVLITGVEKEVPLMRQVAEAAARRGVSVPMWVGAADDLGTLLGLIRHSRLYLGSDTGTMHFAAALGVPVVAQFGGGHWPRFLPVAARSFVATQKLPCFGCGWECWLEEPCCITAVSPDAFKAGIDWILSDAPDERRVNLGAEIDPVSSKVLASARNARVELTERLEAENAARLELIDRLQAENTARLKLIDRLDAESSDRLRLIDELNKDVRELERPLRHDIERLKADGAARLDAVHRLSASLQESETDRAARLDAMHRLTSSLKESEADRAACLDAIHRLTASLKESEADRAARLDDIERLKADGAARLDAIDRLTARLEESEADRAARLDLINDQQRRLQEQQQLLDRRAVRLLRKLRIG